MNSPSSHQADFLIIGGGIAGASAGYWLAPRGHVIMLEREAQPGYHSTGRSAALFMESYGTAQVRALTMASRAFFEDPPAGFASQPLIAPRGAVMVAAPGQESKLQEHVDILKSVTSRARVLDTRALLEMVPVFRPDRVIGGVLEPDAFDLDVDAIHQGFLRGIRKHGGDIRCGVEVTGLARSAGVWHVTAGSEQFSAPVVLNAAGAWADRIAAMAGARPIGLQPRRRAAFVFPPPEGVSARAWPMCCGVEEDWYFKPDAGMLLGSPANADPVEPQDVQPEEIDIALGIHQIESMTTMTIRRPARTWAGLRSFVADGDLVSGFDTDAEGFYWIAAQGGYGIQTSPAMGRLSASMALGEDVPEEIRAFGLARAMLSPDRLARD